MKNKIFKLLYSFLVMLVLINIFLNPYVYSVNNIHVAAPIATVTKALFAVAQISVSGFFVIKFTLAGIKYFTAVAASDKADNKNEMSWTLFLAVLSYLGIFMIGKLLGV